MVYVLNEHGQPLMPTSRHGKVKHLLRQGKAKVVKSCPFTIQLLYSTGNHTQPITLGIDSGYLNVGFSAVTEDKELISGEVELLTDMSKRIYERSMYRRTRRNRLRYRKPGWENPNIPKGWLAPSIQHKLDSQIRFIESLTKILPITKIVVEVANFDIQKIKNPNIQGEEYQQGEQTGLWNVREYVLHRDNHKCQNPDCKNPDKNPILVTHHLRYRINGATERPEDQVTLCVMCHAPENHKGFLKDWKPKTNNFKDATFMTMVRWRMIDALRDLHGNVEYTYGYITKNCRIALDLEKSHSNDAFCVAGGTNQSRIDPLSVTQVRRNNRSLEKFYDAKYVDTRTGKTVSASELNCGRYVRNKNKNGENLRQYRGEKVSKGRRSIRKKRYFYQPNDLVRYEGNVCVVRGTQNKGEYVALKGIKKVPRVDALTPYKFSSGFVYGLCQ